MVAFARGCMESVMYGKGYVWSSSTQLIKQSLQFNKNKYIHLHIESAVTPEQCSD